MAGQYPAPSGGDGTTLSTLVVIPAFGSPELTDAVLGDLVRDGSNRRPDVRIVVVDNGGDYVVPVAGSGVSVHRPGDEPALDRLGELGAANGGRRTVSTSASCSTTTSGCPPGSSRPSSRRSQEDEKVAVAAACYDDFWLHQRAQLIPETAFDYRSKNRIRDVPFCDGTAIAFAAPCDRRARCAGHGRLPAARLRFRHRSRDPGPRGGAALCRHRARLRLPPAPGHDEPDRSDVGGQPGRDPGRHDEQVGPRLARRGRPRTQRLPAAQHGQRLVVVPEPAPLRMSTRRILYAGFATRRHSGGVHVLTQHVRLLRAAGHEAWLWLPDPGDRTDWIDDRGARGRRRDDADRRRRSARAARDADRPGPRPGARCAHGDLQPEPLLHLRGRPTRARFPGLGAAAGHLGGHRGEPRRARGGAAGTGGGAGPEPGGR